MPWHRVIVSEPLLTNERYALWEALSMEDLKAVLQHLHTWYNRSSDVLPKSAVPGVHRSNDPEGLESAAHRMRRESM